SRSTVRLGRHRGGAQGGGSATLESFRSSLPVLHLPSHLHPSNAMQSRAASRAEPTDMTSLPLSLSAVWPEGLERFNGTIVFYEHELRHDDLLTALKNERIEHRATRHGTLFQLRGNGLSLGYKGFVQITFDDETRR